MADKTPGICSYCGAEIAKNVRSITTHLKKCSKFPVNEKPVPHALLLIEDTYNNDYWMAISVPVETTFKKLDTFLRDVWLECCGHLSHFELKDRRKIGMSKKIEDILHDTSEKLLHIYDYGTSSELTVRLIARTEFPASKHITIIIRNREPDYKCNACGKKATRLCSYCIYEDGGLLCEKCAPTHNCVESDGEEVLLPLVNSPRSGMCGYTGYDEKVVRKHMP